VPLKHLNSIPCVAKMSFLCSSELRVRAALRAPTLPSQNAAVARMAGHRAGATKGGVSAVCEPLGPDRPLWFPGSSPPPWLDGSLPGDFGFDPLGLGNQPMRTSSHKFERIALLTTFCCRSFTLDHSSPIFLLWTS
jgi:light-harvesting complex I chlorophyll a/b binding protein 2